MSRYRFISFWAALHVVAGLAILGLSGVLAGLVLAGSVSFGLPLDTASPSARVPAAVALAFVGLLLGGPAIVVGQLLQILLDQRRLLRLMYRRLRDIDDREAEREAIEQALHRKGRHPETLRDVGS